MENKEKRVAFVNDCHLGLVKDIKEEDDNGNVVYVSTYDVEYANGVGTETFKIKSIKKHPKVIGYSYDIKSKEFSDSLKIDSVK